MARMWVLQSGSSWPVIMTTINANIDLPKSPMMTFGLPSLVFLDFSPFVYFFHFFSPRWSRVECNSQHAAAELGVRCAALCVHQHKFCSRSYSYVFATVGLHTVSIELCQQGGCRGSSHYSISSQHWLCYLQSFCPEKGTFLSYAYLCSAVTILERNGKQFNLDGWF